MSGELRLDTAALRDAGRSLHFVAQEFTDATAHSRDVGDALGHEELAAQVRHFAVSWDDRRAAMVESIAALGEACTAIGEQLEEIDTEFATALRGER